MRADWPLTPVEVEIYRELYYHNYKNLVRQGLDEDEVKLRMVPLLERFDWSWNRFQEYISIDRMQRLVFEFSHDLVNSGARTTPLTSYPEYRNYDPNYGALRLKDNDLSEDPDKIN